MVRSSFELAIFFQNFSKNCFADQLFQLPYGLLMSDISARVTFLGDLSVGKTSIIKRIKGEQFDSSPPSTICASFSSVTLNYHSQDIQLSLWDTAGQEAFRSVAPLTFRDSEIIVFVFAINSEQSLNSLQDFYNLVIQKKNPSSFKPIFVCNKIDIMNGNILSIDRIQEFLETLGLSDTKYFLVSAKTNEGMCDLIDNLAEEVYNLMHNTHPPKNDVIPDQNTSKFNTCCFHF